TGATAVALHSAAGTIAAGRLVRACAEGGEAQHRGANLSRATLASGREAGTCERADTAISNHRPRTEGRGAGCLARESDAERDRGTGTLCARAAGRPAGRSGWADPGMEQWRYGRS